MYSHLSQKNAIYHATIETLWAVESQQRKEPFFCFCNCFWKVTSANSPWCFPTRTYPFAFLCLLRKIYSSSMQSSAHSTQRMLIQGKSQQDDPMGCSRNQAKEVYIWKTIGDSNATLADSSYSCYSLLCSSVIFIALKFYLCWFLVVC